jgi:hypothetical protein
MAEEPVAFTRREWCALARLSIATYYTLQKHGNGPRILRVPNTLVVRVIEHPRDWQERIAKQGVKKDTLRVLHARATKAGKVSGESANHWCRSPEKRAAFKQRKRAGAAG